MIVVDLGCAEHHLDASIPVLVERFHPETLYGFDPWFRMQTGSYYLGDTHLILSQEAAWTHDGTIGVAFNGTRTKVTTRHATRVPCFDLAVFLEKLPQPIVLKLDVEGAEYPLLHHLHATGTDRRLELCLVEWHQPKRIELDCPVEPWHG